MGLDTSILALLRIGVALLGGGIALLAVRAYRRSQMRSMLLLSAGFSLITAGIVLTGVLFEFLGYTITRALIAEALLVLGGLSLILLSIYYT